MSIKFQDAEPTQAIKPKTIFIDGIEVGDCTPTLQSDGSLSWMAVIKLGGSYKVSTASLYGHGKNPAHATADAIINGRLERDSFIERLSKIEQSLGVANKSNDEIKASLL